MKYKQSINLLLLGLVLLLASGCARGNANKSINHAQGKDAAPPQKLLLFQKTPCYGTCPAYNATFYSDGTINYEGFRYVPVTGTLTLQLSEKQLQQVKEMLHKLDYTSLKYTYLSPYTDLPSSYLTFYENDREVRRIKHQQDGPEALQGTITYLHKLVMELLEAK